MSHSNRPAIRYSVLLLCAALAGCSRGTDHAAGRPLEQPVRAIPSSFPPDTNLPEINEVKASGAIDLSSFSPGRDLIYVNDARAWWESDHDKQADDEDDHTIHASMEIPLRRLVELVSAAGGILEIHDAYRPAGIHNPRSLHKEGRAIDVTCDEMSLEKLAGLCWAAGFDWVLHEASARAGAHVHCSVRRNRR
ncbi:MAG: hypothetical protein HQ559_02900 [Lentisphaerae bacterium]|nr:hypothetical protein [Lentisphaerota bacterium]